MNWDLVLQITTIASGVIMALLVLLQQRGATLGAGFGASGELFTTRRGVEKSVFNATIVFATIFVCSIIAMLFLPN